MIDDKAIDQYLRGCRQLAQLTSQNGWIDNDTLRFNILRQDSDSALIFVEFDEILVEGSGCIAGRVPCHGRLHLRMSGDGQVHDAKVL